MLILGNTAPAISAGKLLVGTRLLELAKLARPARILKVEKTKTKDEHKPTNVEQIALKRQAGQLNS